MQWLISNRCPSNINYLRTLMYFHPDRPKTDWLIQAVSKTGQQDRTSPKLWLTWSLQAETYLANIRQHLRYTSHRARHTQLQLKNHKIGFSHVYLVSESTNTPDNKMSQGSQQRSKNPSQNCAHERGKKKKKNLWSDEIFSCAIGKTTSSLPLCRAYFFSINLKSWQSDHETQPTWQQTCWLLLLWGTFHF